MARLTAQAVLCLVGCLHLAAFSSLLLQLPLLFGSHGLQPVSAHLVLAAQHVLPAGAGSYSEHAWALMASVPTLLWHHAALGLSAEALLGLVCLAGAALGFVVACGLAHPLAFGCLWLLYLSVAGVGQPFLPQPGDALLLELTFACIWLAPVCQAAQQQQQQRQQQEEPEQQSEQQQQQAQPQAAPAPPALLLLRWLLFKLLLLSSSSTASRVCAAAPGGLAGGYRALLAAHGPPHVLTWLSEALPGPLAALAAAVVVLELPAAFLALVLAPSVQRPAAAGLLALRLTRLALGAAGLADLAAAVLCFALLDDRSLGHALQRLALRLGFAAPEGGALQGQQQHTSEGAAHAGTSAGGGSAELLAYKGRGRHQRTLSNESLTSLTSLFDTADLQQLPADGAEAPRAAAWSSRPVQAAAAAGALAAAALFGVSSSAGLVLRASPRQLAALLHAAVPAAALWWLVVTARAAWQTCARAFAAAAAAAAAAGREAAAAAAASAAAVPLAATPAAKQAAGRAAAAAPGEPLPSPEPLAPAEAARPAAASTRSTRLLRPVARPPSASASPPPRTAAAASNGALANGHSADLVDGPAHAAAEAGEEPADDGTAAGPSTAAPRGRRSRAGASGSTARKASSRSGRAASAAASEEEEGSDAPPAPAARGSRRGTSARSRQPAAAAAAAAAVAEAGSAPGCDEAEPAPPGAAAPAAGTPQPLAAGVAPAAPATPAAAGKQPAAAPAAPGALAVAAAQLHAWLPAAWTAVAAAAVLALLVVSLPALALPAGYSRTALRSLPGLLPAYVTARNWGAVAGANATAAALSASPAAAAAAAQRPGSLLVFELFTSDTTSRASSAGGEADADADAPEGPAPGSWVPVRFRGALGSAGLGVGASLGQRLGALRGWHEPRLGQRLVAAGAGGLEDNVWLVSLADKVLEGAPELRSVLEGPVQRHAWVRADLLRYTPSHLVPAAAGAAGSSGGAWHVEHVDEVLPPVSRSDSLLKEVLTELRGPAAPPGGAAAAAAAAAPGADGPVLAAAGWAAARLHPALLVAALLLAVAARHCLLGGGLLQQALAAC